MVGAAAAATGTGGAATGATDAAASPSPSGVTGKSGDPVVASMVCCLSGDSPGRKAGPTSGSPLRKTASGSLLVHDATTFYKDVDAFRRAIDRRRAPARHLGRSRQLHAHGRRTLLLEREQPRPVREQVV